MKILERDLETMIFNAIIDGKIEDLCKRGFPVWRGKKPLSARRQFPVIVNGVADIVTMHKLEGEKPMVTLYELKTTKIDHNTLFQAFRYLKGMQFVIEERGYDFEKYDFRIVLIGPEILWGDWIFLIQEDRLPVDIFTYRMDITGVYFEDPQIWLYGT